jgi:uncharacterized protein (AIM24 family)
MQRQSKVGILALVLSCCLAMLSALSCGQNKTDGQSSSERGRDAKRAVPSNSSSQAGANLPELAGTGWSLMSLIRGGHIVPIHFKQGQELHVREHQFLAATSNIDYTFERVKGVSNMLLGSTGFLFGSAHRAG